VLNFCSMRQLALISLITLSAATQNGQAATVPSLDYCVATNLQLSVAASVEHITYDDPRRPPFYFTNINIFATNVGVGSCYLMGTPQLSLTAHGRDVGAPYMADRTDLLAAAASPTDLVLGPLLPPYRVTRQYAQIAGSWNAPYCRRKVLAHVTVQFTDRAVTVPGTLPSPPCTGKGPGGTHTSGWYVH
jgi:hypothetical protein